MNRVKFHYGKNMIPFEVFTEKDVDVYIDERGRKAIPEGNIRIVILEEPKKGRIYKYVKDNKHLYTHLLTFHEELLTSNKRAKKFLMMHVWMRDYILEEKRFSVSYVVGGKNDPAMEGYELRHEVWRKRNRITIPKEFYLSGNAPNFHTFVPWDEVDYTNELVLGDSKKPLFDSMFHIAIENTLINNYFTEKIIDCFLSRTVPIYYGDKNIGNHFNSNGIIEVNSVNEIIGICNRLDISVYERMLPLLNDNYESALEYQDYNVRIRNEILKYIDDTV